MYLHSNFSMKQVKRNIKKCCISLYRLVNQHIFVRLQIKYFNSQTKLEIWTKFWTTPHAIYDHI